MAANARSRSNVRVRPSAIVSVPAQPPSFSSTPMLTGDHLGKERSAAAAKRYSEPLPHRSAEIGKRGPAPERYRTNARSEGQQRHTLACVVRRGGRWVV